MEINNKKKKKMIAPIVITILIILYYLVFYTVAISLISSKLAIFLGIVPLIISIAMMTVCIQRIKEIKRGEEDDISKY
jgi:hypothetical protein